MANLEYSRCRIAGIAVSVPERIRRSDEFTDFIGEDGVDKFVKTVGIVQGHICDESMTASDLCADAAERLIADLAIDRQSIGALLFVSQTPDYVAPSTACVLQHRLGLSEECLAYDINLACSGYVYGVSAAMAYLQARGIERVLLLSGDTVSRHCSPEDRALTMLSTDAGSATLIERADTTTRTSRFTLRTQGQGFRSLIVPYGGYRHRFGNATRVEIEPGVSRCDYDGYMDGTEVFRFSVMEVPKLFKAFYEHFAVDPATIAQFFLHQANLFIIGNVAKRVKIEKERLPISIDRYGNTGAATIPTTICDHYARESAREVTEDILICGFGIGLSLGIGTVPLEGTRILPIGICNATFDDRIEALHDDAKPFINP
ncbi:MAG: hypothetical protein KDG55_06745 [Rhodocyclaceae bacterium]|nr:hypothetical protein [Rhodocyclaceae bacterium]